MTLIASLFFVPSSVTVDPTAAGNVEVVAGAGVVELAPMVVDGAAEIVVATDDAGEVMGIVLAVVASGCEITVFDAQAPAAPKQASIASRTIHVPDVMCMPAVYASQAAWVLDIFGSPVVVRVTG